jgi:flagellar basal body-associated protein FliL
MLLLFIIVLLCTLAVLGTAVAIFLLVRKHRSSEDDSEKTKPR